MYTRFRSSAPAVTFASTDRFLGTILAAASILFFAFTPSIHAGYLNLAWDGPTTNVDGTALTDLSLYRVYFGTSGSPCNSSSSQDVPSASPYGGGTVTTQVTGLVAGATYAVQVAAVDLAGGESECSGAVSAPALAEGGDTTPPAGSVKIYNGAAYTAWTDVTVNLAATDTGGVVGYVVSSGSTPPGSGSTGWVPVAVTTSYSSTVPYTLSSGDGAKTVYAWYKDIAGNVSSTASAAITLDQTPPSGGTLAATAGNAQVTLTWSGFSDGGSGLASSNPYKLVYSTGGYPTSTCSSGTALLTGSATSFTHTGLTNGTAYFYRVCASDKAGNMSAGATATATPLNADTTSPSIKITSPTSKTSYNTTNGSLTLAGTASDNIGVTAVTWKNNMGSSGTATGTTSWTVSGITLKVGKNVLTVTARDAAGNTQSATLTVMKPK